MVVRVCYGDLIRLLILGDGRLTAGASPGFAACCFGGILTTYKIRRRATFGVTHLSHQIPSNVFFHFNQTLLKSCISKRSLSTNNARFEDAM